MVALLCDLSIIFHFQGQAVAQLCSTIPNVTVFGTASTFKHEAIKDSVTHLFDRNADYVQEVKSHLLLWTGPEFLQNQSLEDRATGQGQQLMQGDVIGSLQERMWTQKQTVDTRSIRQESCRSSPRKATPAVRVITPTASLSLGKFLYPSAAFTSPIITTTLRQAECLTLNSLRKPWTQCPTTWWQVEKVNPIKLYEENKVIAGFSLLNLLFKQGRAGLIQRVVDKLIGLYTQKKIKPVVDSLWALEEELSSEDISVVKKMIALTFTPVIWLKTHHKTGFPGDGEIPLYVLFTRWHQKDCCQIFSEASGLMSSSQVLAYSLDQIRGINDGSADRDLVNSRTDTQIRECVNKGHILAGLGCSKQMWGCVSVLREEGQQEFSLTLSFECLSALAGEAHLLLPPDTAELPKATCRSADCRKDCSFIGAALGLVCGAARGHPRPPERPALRKRVRPCVRPTYVKEAMQRIHDRGNIGKLILDVEKTPTPLMANDSTETSEAGEEEEDHEGDSENKERMPFIQ
ncbi:hypothetical protein CB1_000349009 [Camelus ferus]|nr:hypothetical protein CB1_000349009 [Camelus ferus]